MELPDWLASAEFAALQAIHLDLLEKLEAAGAEIPFPNRTLWVRSPAPAATEPR